jgi:calcineurin-like phosphoesterase family protein
MAEPAYTPSYLPKQSGKKKLWITADEHYQHNNIIKYCKRPFANAEEMGAALRDKHNAVVGPEDSVLHVGDFTMSSNIDYVLETIQALNGKHYFMQGNHDMWLYELANAGELGKIRLLPQLFG